MNYRLPTLLILVLLLAGRAHAEPLEVGIRLASGNEITSQAYPAAGDTLVLWMTGQYGRIEEEEQAAKNLAARGVETWVTDFVASYFLPQLPSSYGEVPQADLGEWLAAVHARHPDRRIVLVAAGHAASLALRSASAWRALQPESAATSLRGALLLFPLLYRDLQPGQEPAYAPEAAVGGLDLVILQPKSSAGYWWRERLKAFLEQAGSRVTLEVLPGLRDGFYRRGDNNSREIEAGNRLDQIVLDGLKPLIGKP
jgi:hypothetical protein